MRALLFAIYLFVRFNATFIENVLGKFPFPGLRNFEGEDIRKSACNAFGFNFVPLTRPHIFAFLTTLHWQN